MAAKEKSQREKFIEKAKEIGADDEESAKAFERAFKKVAQTPAKTKGPAEAGPLDSDNI